MKQLRTVRGVHDILPGQYRYFKEIVRKASLWAERYGFDPIALPIIENEEVFRRPLGETSDIISKEMFVLQQRDKSEKIVLRPEATASVVRSFLQHGLQNLLPQKLYYWGPMFRYERPQKGRLRQFNQFGVEFIGIDDPYQDVEVITLGYHLLKDLGLIDDVTLHINTLGDTHSRAAYREALVDYFTSEKKKLSEESLKRLALNPMRILDSKDSGDQELCRQGPQFSAYLSKESKDHFKRVCDGLEVQGIQYKHNTYLVRGLDYYCHTAFEFITDRLGAQSAVLAGGRYDSLTAYMGGAPVDSMGWAAGIERLILLMEGKETYQLPEKYRISFVPLDRESEVPCWQLVQLLRENGFSVDILWKGNVGKRLKKLDKAGVDVAILMGEDERRAENIVVKFLKESKQETVSVDSLLSFLQAIDR